MRDTRLFEAQRGRSRPVQAAPGGRLLPEVSERPAMTAPAPTDKLAAACVRVGGAQ